jgi:hypothetical protein
MPLVRNERIWGENGSNGYTTMVTLFLLSTTKVFKHKVNIGQEDIKPKVPSKEDSSHFPYAYSNPSDHL